MTLKECYEKMGGDYIDTINRLTKEERIAKYVVKFLDDVTFQALCEAMKENDKEEIFCAIHTLKGVSQNLGFTKLYEASREMTEAVRNNVTLGNEELFQMVEKAYFETIDVIREYQKGL